MDMQSDFPPGVISPVVWMTGLPGAGKTTMANALLQRLLDGGVKAIVLDGDTLRAGLCSDLGFSDTDRIENIRRFAHVARLFQYESYVVIVSTISPLQAHRDLARSIVGQGFFETYVSTPVEVCRVRDPKGMYARAERGQLVRFTGVSDTYESPAAPDITIDTANRSVERSVVDIMTQLARLVEWPSRFRVAASSGRLAC